MASTVQFLAVLMLHLCIASSSLSFHPSRRGAQVHDYLRFADVSHHCQSVLSSATELTYDAHRADRVNWQLSFEKGDWRQDAGKAPLLPFDGGDAPQKGGRRLLDPLSLATFLVTHVDGDDEHRARAAINISGVLVLTVARQSPMLDFGPHISAMSPEFNFSAGSTRLKIVFEGVYTERARGNGDEDGEQVLCMVGSALLPKRSADDSVDPWEWTKNSGGSSFQPPVTADNNILLVLRYPRKLTLTTRAVVGRMGSTSSASDASYFDSVQLISALISCCTYHFRPEELVAGVGDALPSRDVYNGSYPCLVLNRYGYNGRVQALADGVGPFEMDRAADADVFGGVHILMQGVYCQEQQQGAGTAMVSMVFRAVSPWEDWGMALMRSGLSGQTLSAEGVWNASTGQACMVACRGGTGTGTAGRKACDLRVCLFFPTTMSITRLDTMVGQINGVDAAGDVVHPPLLKFRQHMSSPRVWGSYPGGDGELVVPYKYNYTKVNQAVELRQRSGSRLDLRRIVPLPSSSLPLGYPRRDNADGGGYMRSLSTLAARLGLSFMTVPGLFRHVWIERPVMYLEVISLEQLIDRYTPLRHWGVEPGPEGHRSLLNVSAKLAVSQGHRPENSVMSLEGVYSPDDGRMHLIGCRDARLPRRNSSASSRDLQLEDGMDCSIEVKIEYPRNTMHHFIMSTAEVQIASTRTATDPLHFDALNLRALPLHDPQQHPGDHQFYRGVVNGVLCIVLLSAAIAAARSQLGYLKSHADVAPYISLVMLGVQALGYGMPLVTGVEAILARVTLRSSSGDVAQPPSADRTPYYMFDRWRLCETIHQAVKVLSLCALALTLRLGQKVRRSRARLVARVPSDRKVLVCHCGVHLVLFLLILALNREAVTVEQQAALMQDLFLLPQVIGNAVWRVNCRPLKGSFYVGVTAVRLLPHVHGYLMQTAAVAGARYPYQQEFEDAASRGRFFARAGDVVIPLAAVVLALVVHAQQRWNYVIVSRMGKLEQKKLQHIF